MRQAPGLAALQQLFADSLRASGDAAPSALAAWLKAPQPAPAALAVYRRSARHAQRAALTAVYPVLAALVGEALFAALCSDHLSKPGSRSGDLHQFGSGFATTVRAEAACADYPFLPEVAELEWQVHRSFFVPSAAGETAIDPATLAPEALPRLKLLLSPGLTLLACATPAGRIWRAHQPDAGEALSAIDPAAGPEWLAVQRVAAGVRVDSLSAAEFRILQCGMAGLTLAQALDELSPDLSAALALDRCLPHWLQQGLVQGLGLAPG